MRPDLEIIQQWIEPGSRVLDLGCGDGSLLSYLNSAKNVSSIGLEIDASNIEKCIASGVNVIEQNMDDGSQEEVESSWWNPLSQDTIEVLKKDPIDEQRDHFLNVIKGIEAPLVTIEDGCKNLSVLEAIKESAQIEALVKLK